jgi:Secretion system C-terminal sorting domain
VYLFLQKKNTKFMKKISMFKTSRHKTLIVAASLLFNSSIAVRAQFYDVAPCAQNPNVGTALNLTAPSFTCYVNGYGSNQIENPFYAVQLRNQNILAFSDNLFKDNAPADGWVPVQWSFGTPAQPIDHPYFIMYNINSGKLRFFLAVTNLPNQNDKSMVTMHYGSGRRSALLEYQNAKGYLNSIEDFDNNVPEVKVGNFFENSRPYWLHADFDMHYDPCACEFASNLIFRVTLFQNTNLSFSLNGSLLQNLLGADNPDNQGKYGSKGNQGLLSIFSPGTSFWKDAEKGLSIVEKLFAAKPAETKKALPGWLSYIPKVGTIAGGVNFLLGLFKSSQPVPAKPLSFKMDLKGSGTLSQASPYRTVPLVVPGSNQTNVSPAVIPHYNNIMGVFTLLKTPTVRVNRYFTSSSGYNEYGQYGYVWEYTEDTYHQYEIPDIATQLKYHINPRAGISTNPADIDIRASFVFKIGGVEQVVTDPVYVGCMTNYKRAMSFGYYSGGHYSSWGTFIPDTVLLRLYVKLKTNNGQDFVQVLTYLTNQQFVDVSTPPYENVNPPAGCNTGVPMATNADILAVCRSTKYRNKASQYQRFIIPEDTLSNAPQGIEKNAAISLYPNPLNRGAGQLVLSSTVNFRNPAEIRLYDLSGKLVTTIANRVFINRGANRFNFATQRLAAGTYVVQVVTTEGTFNKRLVLQ